MKRWMCGLIGAALVCQATLAVACSPMDFPPRSQYGMNLSAGELLDPTMGVCRLDAYLTEIEREGFAKEIRIIFGPDWGPQILRDWIPVIRLHGFKVLPILSQSNQDADLDAQIAWVAYGLPQIADLLLGVTPQSESNDTTGWSPEHYARWHRALVPHIRAAVPGVPILSPTLNNAGDWRDWDRDTGLIPGVDYDVRAANVSNWGKKALKKLASHVAEDPETVPVWLTEARWDEVQKLRKMGVRVEKTFVFVWNEWEGGSMAVRPGGTTPPTCPRPSQEGYPQ